MVRIRVQDRLILTFGLYALTIFGFGGFLFYEGTRRQMENELGEKLLAVGNLVAAEIGERQRTLFAAGAGVESRSAMRVSERLAVARRAANLHRLYVFDRSGYALADAEPREPLERYPELDFEREALQGVFDQQRAVVGHLFTGLEGKIYKAAYLPLSAEGKVEVGLAVVASATFLEAISRLRDGILVASLVGLAVSIALSVLTARAVVRPIRRLVSAADRIGAGDLVTRVPDAGRDEIGYLGRTLERMRSAVLERERSLRAMLASVAHEVRNPLGGIELLAGLLRREVKPDTPSAEQVDRILIEVQHLNGIIQDFLDYARPAEPRRRAFAVGDVAVEVGEVLKGALSGAHVEYRVDCGDVQLEADPAQLRQVLINLVQNAVQAQEERGGSVVVRAYGRDGAVEVRVEDEGPGITDAARERVFEPFFTTRQSGSGLGLAIARELVRRSGGDLTIENRVPRGVALVMRWTNLREDR
jgi:signal transduction histidine kinase